MKTRYVLAVGVALLAVVGVTIAQQQRPSAIPPQTVTIPNAHSIPTTAVAADPFVVAAPAPHQQAVAAKPEDLTIDQLIEAVDGFREQKAEIEKKERAYLKVLHRKAQSQKERIDGLGGDGQVPPTLVPGPAAPSSSYSIPPVVGSIPTQVN